MVRIEERYKALLSDNYSGSSDLLKQTVAWVDTALNDGRSEKEILKDLGALCKIHPAMALLQNFHRFFLKIPLNSKRIRAWMDKYKRHETAACRRFSAHLNHFKNVLVHSNSGHLYRSLKEVSTSLNIFCTESRPVMEGITLAEKLAQTHHRIYLITDMAAFSVIPRVEVLAFGCDAITPRGIVNKSGTAALSEISQKQGRMNYFIGTSEKILDDWNDDILLREGPREEIYEENGSLQVENYYFDLTPSSLITGIFLEKGEQKDE